MLRALLTRRTDWTVLVIACALSFSLMVLERHEQARVAWFIQHTLLGPFEASVGWMDSAVGVYWDNQHLRQRLTRRLLDEPVLYYDELTEAELAYLTGQRGAITARITELTGLIAEVRAEGIAMVDPHDDLTDVRMPDTGTDGHVTLLLAEFLAARCGARQSP